MRRSRALTRKAFFVDPRALQRARRALGLRSDAEAVRRSLDHVAEMDAFWNRATNEGGRRDVSPGSVVHSAILRDVRLYLHRFSLGLPTTADGPVPDPQTWRDDVCVGPVPRIPHLCLGAV